jgi:predicted DNA-binding transcriptional regulator YafY
MFELQTKIKRQIEIVGLCLEDDTPLKPVDLAEMFHCEELTIKRDLQELRSYGIDIHSVQRKGVCLSSPLDTPKLRALVMQYIGLCTSEHTVDRATMLMVRKLKAAALRNVVRLQRSIENNRIAVVDYQKEEQEVDRGREICPLQLFQSEGYWRVLAVNDGLIKQYHLNKFLHVRETDRRFTPVPREVIDDMFRYSFRSWVGSERHVVRIQLSHIWAGRIKPAQLMETQVITENEDGSVVFEATVNSLEEIASWVVSRGEGVKVLEPAALRELVTARARGALSNYT